MPQTTSKQKS